MNKIAIVHDYLNQFGGAERVVVALHELFPEAPIYTSVYDAGRMPSAFKKMDIRTSFMQNIPLAMKFYRWFFWLYPFAFQSFDLNKYDLVISSSSAFAKGIKKRQGAIHACYCHNPMRFVWRFKDYIKHEKISVLAKILLPLLVDRLKKWDIMNNKGVDYFIVNGKAVAERVRKNYGRESIIINPPIETGLFNPRGGDGDYFLLVSRLNAYKRIDIAVEAFSKLGLPLKIVGAGPAGADIKKSSAGNIDFLGQVDDNKLRELYSGCRALIFTEEADFGMVLLEAAASGRPVIAFGAGGALEIVIDRVTGLLFPEQTAESLKKAVYQFLTMSFDRNRIRDHSKKFDKEVFKSRIKGFLNEIQAF